MVTITESPREAMQGLQRSIPTEEKIAYVRLLMKAGFDIVDVGSIVNPRFVPAMADTLDVVNALEPVPGTSVMVLVASLKGAETAVMNDKINMISFPFSVSPAFQKKNINKTIEESRELLIQINAMCKSAAKELIVYVPMAFGNPYDDPWDNEILLSHVEFLKELGVCNVYLSNVSVPANERVISAVYKAAIPFFPNIEFGLHLHTVQSDWEAQMSAAWDAGCRNFDGVLSGLGGCPMSNKMLGNLDTDLIIEFLEKKGIDPGLDMEVVREARAMAGRLFTA